jgi:cyclic beta-1,2-glucan synthetase
MSESAYNTVDAQLNYQYRAFGVPGLGLKRGLGDDLVVAPYASVMALMVGPGGSLLPTCSAWPGRGSSAASASLRPSTTPPTRQPPGPAPGVVVRAFMAHHQGMSLLALAWTLLRPPDAAALRVGPPNFQAVMPLLQERIPKVSGVPFPCTCRAVGPAFTFCAP